MRKDTEYVASWCHTSKHAIDPEIVEPQNISYTVRMILNNLAQGKRRETFEQIVDVLKNIEVKSHGASGL